MTPQAVSAKQSLGTGKSPEPAGTNACATLRCAGGWLGEVAAGHRPRAPEQGQDAIGELNAATRRLRSRQVTGSVVVVAPVAQLDRASAF